MLFIAFLSVSGDIYNRIYVLWIIEAFSQENQKEQQNIPAKGKMNSHFCISVSHVLILSDKHTLSEAFAWDNF